MTTLELHKQLIRYTERVLKYLFLLLVHAVAATGVYLLLRPALFGVFQVNFVAGELPWLFGALWFVHLMYLIYLEVRRRRTKHRLQLYEAELAGFRQRKRKPVIYYEVVEDEWDEDAYEDYDEYAQQKNSYYD